MCGAYGFSIHDAKEVYDRFQIANQLEDLQPRFNLRPGQLNPVITSHSHIPSDLVVDQWVSNVESSSPHDCLLLHDLWTTFRHLLWSQITSVISTAWDFATKSGGMWKF
jgi:hypothetical protein